MTQNRSAQSVRHGVRLIVAFVLAGILHSTGTGTAQTPAHLSGRVLHAETARPIENANITLAGTSFGAASDSAGRFVLRNLPAGVYTIVVEVIGFHTHRQRIEVTDAAASQVVVRLRPSILPGDEVRVERQRPQDARLEVSPPTMTIRPQQVEQQPGAFDDVLRVLHTLPGVVVPNDYSNQFSVRGGNPNQNLLLLDGVELYNPYRRDGMASLVNPAIIEDTRFYAGGFPALFGDRLSSVLAVQSRDGTRERWFGGQAGASMTNAYAVLEGKTDFWSGSWLVSGRRSFYDLFARDFVRDLGIVNDIAFPNFKDVQAKVVLHPAPMHRLQLHALYGENVTDYLSRDEIGRQGLDSEGFEGTDRMENSVLGAAWTFTPSSRLQTRIAANGYRNTGSSGFGGNLVPQGAFQGVSLTSPFVEFITFAPLGGQIDTLFFDYGQRYQFDRVSIYGWLLYQPGSHQIEIGAGGDRLDNSLASTLALDEFGEAVFAAMNAAPNFFGALADTLVADRPYNRWHIYLQDKIELAGGRAWLQPGLRLDHYGINDKAYLSPRLSARYEFSATTGVQLAAGRYWQSAGFEKLLDGARIFSLLRFSSLAQLDPEQADHVVLGISHRPTAGWHLTIEAYAKRLSNLITQAYAEQAYARAVYNSLQAPAFALAYRIEPRVLLRRTATAINNAGVDAYGIDVLLERRAASPRARWSGTLSYAFSKATETQQIGGQAMKRPYEYDRRHAFNAGLTFRLMDGLRLGVNWRFATGLPTTPAVRVEPLLIAGEDPQQPGRQIYNVLTDPETGYARFVPDYGAPENVNSARLPEYHRLDLRLSFAGRLRQRPFEVYVDVINAYNRKNVLSYQPLIRIEGDNPSLPLALRFPKPVLYRQPVYMLPLMPSFGFRFSF